MVYKLQWLSSHVALNWEQRNLLDQVDESYLCFMFHRITNIYLHVFKNLSESKDGANICILGWVPVFVLQSKTRLGCIGDLGCDTESSQT